MPASSNASAIRGLLWNVALSHITTSPKALPTKPYPLIIRFLVYLAIIEKLPEAPEQIENNSQDSVILEKLLKNEGALNSLGHEIKKILTEVIAGEIL
ncbi:MAG: hypothetical protein HEQ32_04230 [Vampirovibrio sp.]